MIRRIALATLLAAATAGPSLAQDAEVAGRPALTTKSTQDLVKQRDVWGKKPSMTSAQAVSAAEGPMVAGRPALSTKSTAELIKEREQWGKGKVAAGSKRATKTKRKVAAVKKSKKKKR